MSQDLHDTAVSIAKEADGRRRELVGARCIPSDVFKRAADGGLFHQMVAQQLGGLGVSPVEWFENGIDLAKWEPFDSTDDGYRLVAKDCALKRLGNVSDIADPVLYLASELAGYATGTVHVVDGGMSID